MNQIKKYREWGSYFIEIDAPTKRVAERVMLKIERAIESLYARRNRGVGVVEWWFDAPKAPLGRVEDDKEED